ncbi:hypothetical protein AXA88_24935 [Salmonella enterica]|nr:hypothetical protein [Salmonella enterica]EAX3609105.1 hypothetical protein [Salmonella enterica]EGW6282677.1 hypothetical protein [Salmonella enterica]EGX3935066.1 hypothetical protein [Salmonella enterica]
MRLMKLYNFILLIGIVFIWWGGWIGKSYIESLISHNVAINLLILSLFIASTLWVFIDGILFFIKINAIEKIRKTDDNSKKRSELLKKIFGGKYYNTILSEDEYDKDILSRWKDNIEWKPRILEYLSGTLIGLGLLGTFIGLMRTLANVFNVISQDLQGRELIASLGEPLSGMSVAFSASMLGLGSSLIAGLISIIVSKSNSEYTREVENWLHIEYKNKILNNSTGAYVGKNISLFKEVISYIKEIRFDVNELKRDINTSLILHNHRNELLNKVITMITELTKIDHIIYEMKEANDINKISLDVSNKMAESINEVREKLNAFESLNEIKEKIEEIKFNDLNTIGILESIKNDTQNLKYIDKLIDNDDVLGVMLIQNNQRIENLHARLNSIIQNEIEKNADLKKEYLSFKLKTEELNENINSKNEGIENILMRINEIKNMGEQSLNESVAIRTIAESWIKIKAEGRS